MKTFEKYIGHSNATDTLYRSKQNSYFVRARDYCKVIFYSKHNDLFPDKEGSLYRRYHYYNVWPKIKKIVLDRYNATVIEDMPDDKREEANDFAIKIIDELYEEFKEDYNRIFNYAKK